MAFEYAGIVSGKPHVERIADGLSTHGEFPRSAIALCCPPASLVIVRISEHAITL